MNSENTKVAADQAVVSQPSRPIFVAVHYCHWQCEWGENLSWPEFHVYAGAWPFGPRGGRCRNILRGRYVNGRWRRDTDAAQWAAEYAAENGYRFVKDAAEARAVLAAMGLAPPKAA